MKHVRLFRVLVLASTATYCVWFFLPILPSYPSGEEYQLTQHSGYRAILPVENALYFNTWFVLSIISAIGMFLIQNWARHLFLALATLNVVAAPLSGFLVQSPIDVMLSTTNLLLDGAIMALAYISPLSQRFTRSRGPTRP